MNLVTASVEAENPDDLLIFRLTKMNILKVISSLHLSHSVK